VLCLSFIHQPHERSRLPGLLQCATTPSEDQAAVYASDSLLEGHSQPVACSTTLLLQFSPRHRTPTLALVLSVPGLELLQRLWGFLKEHQMLFDLVYELLWKLGDGGNVTYDPIS
jgi:hypothetical protein